MLFGDFDQLQPVRDDPLYTDCPSCPSARNLHCAKCEARRATDGGDESSTGRRLFRNHFRAFFELKHNFRSGQDRTLASALKRAANGRAPRASVLAKINTRVMSVEKAARSVDADALWTSPYRKVVKELNESALKRLTKALRVWEASQEVEADAQHPR
jgi:hypothetical protein